jgi:hypothetical protein
MNYSTRVSAKHFFLCLLAPLLGREAFANESPALAKNFIDELITLADGENIAGNGAQPWLNLPDEYIVAKAPQVIIEAGMGSERRQIARHWGRPQVDSRRERETRLCLPL